MKKIYTSIFLIFIIIASSKAQKQIRIGYVDMNVVLNKNNNYKASQKTLDEKIEQWKKEIELRKIKLKQIQDQFQAEKILLTPELIADRELEIKIFADEIISLQEKRFGPEGDMVLERNMLLKPLQDQVLTIVQEIAKEKKYDFIFDRSSDLIMLYSTKNYDISDLVIKRIELQERIKNRNEKIQAAKKVIGN
ncbi:MAG: OmpH family outer membrane protein [Flavobacteriaceae bacterium]|jgi:Skp family chaperone for outer membrane proteins|nr:OmpH family outer membrane protein [Flavobacteriaceae bacterium]|tara:strand:- start:81 stop:659 length:579 start_codon:yes stop_codon:yes gene_type:complete